MTKEERYEIFRTASLCRAFEEEVFKQIKNKVFKYPLYLSAGQEFISATIAHFYKGQKPLIFAQHRAHSTYLSFGGNIDSLVKELLGKPDGCSGGMGGSASIQSKEINMFGHDGLMGSHIPIAVGACFTSRQPTIAIVGDAAAEEDYVMAAIAWAGTKKLPILFVVEDNKLSILTEKKVRRNWEMHDFAKSVSVEGYDVDDEPEKILNILNTMELPCLLNINTDRLFWHAGAGIDEYEKRDRFKLEKEAIGLSAHEVYSNARQYVEYIWRKHLETQ